jgi:hypothetical protein
MVLSNAFFAVLLLIVSGCQTKLSGYEPQTLESAAVGADSNALQGQYLAPDAPSYFGYPQTQINLNAGQEMISMRPNVASPAATYFEVSPALPPGLALHASTGEISGTPVANASAGTVTTAHTFSAGNSAGYRTQVVQISITTLQPPAPPPISGVPPATGGLRCALLFCVPEFRIFICFGAKCFWNSPECGPTFRHVFRGLSCIAAGVSSQPLDGRNFGPTDRRQYRSKHTASNASGECDWLR